MSRPANMASHPKWSAASSCDSETTGTFLWIPGTVQPRVPFRRPSGAGHRRALAEIAIAELVDFVLINRTVLDEDDPPILAQLENFVENFRAWRWEAERHRGFGQERIGDEDELVALARENMFAAFDALERG